MLDQALNLYDSNAIIVAVLHMTHTLSHEMFVREMLNKPDAMDQYISFLMADSKWEECLKLFDELGRTGNCSRLLEFELFSPCEMNSLFKTFRLKKSISFQNSPQTGKSLTFFACFRYILLQRIRYRKTLLAKSTEQMISWHEKLFASSRDGVSG